MGQFKVLAGVHVDENGEYREGEVVNSDLPLDQMFKNKFEKLRGNNVKGKKSARRDEEDEDDEEDNVDFEPDRTKRKNPVMDDDNVAVKQKKIRSTKPFSGPGDVTEEVVEGSSKKSKSRVSVEVEEGDSDSAGESEEEVPAEFGTEVTDDFPGAKEGQLRVFHNDDSGQFTVVLAEKPTESLSDSPLKNRKSALKCVSMNAVPQ